MNMTQNKGFLPSILKINGRKRKSGNKSDKILSESESNSPAKRTTERLYDNKLSELASSLVSTKINKKSALISPNSSTQFIKNGYTIINYTNKVKEPIPDTSRNNIGTATVTSRISRFQNNTMRADRHLSRDSLKETFSPSSKLIISSELRLSKSLNQRTKKHEFNSIIEHRKHDTHLYLPSMDNINDISINSLEERKSYDGQFHSCEDDIEEHDIICPSIDLIHNQQQIEIDAETYGLNRIQISSNQMNSNNKVTNIDVSKKAEELKKKKKGFSALSEMLPTNLEKEQQIFFMNKFKYNPVFEYASTHIKHQFSKPHTKYLKISKLILNKCIEEYGSDEVYLEKTGGRLITKEETTHFFERYINELGLGEYLTLTFSENTVI